MLLSLYVLEEYKHTQHRIGKVNLFWTKPAQYSHMHILHVSMWTSPVGGKSLMYVAQG